MTRPERALTRLLIRERTTPTLPEINTIQPNAYPSFVTVTGAGHWKQSDLALIGIILCRRICKVNLKGSPGIASYSRKGSGSTGGLFGNPVIWEVATFPSSR